MDDLAAVVGARAACCLLGFSRATLLRHQEPTLTASKTRMQTKWARKISDAKRQAILDALHCEGFADRSVRAVCATSLDESTYLGSISTMYRVLRDAEETQERRRVATHPARIEPELAATAPRQVWC